MACERANGARVTHIVVEIGTLSMVLPDAVRFCFDVCSADTPAAGATLEIIEIPGLGKCRSCGAEVEMQMALARCACGNMDLEWLRGEELKLKEVEVCDVCDMRMQ